MNCNQTCHICRIIRYITIQYNTIQCNALPCHAMQSHTIPIPIPYHTILYISYHTILFHNRYVTICIVKCGDYFFFFCFKTAHTWKGSPSIIRRLPFLCLATLLTFLFRKTNPSAWSNRTQLRINHKVIRVKRRLESIDDHPVEKKWSKYNSIKKISYKRVQYCKIIHVFLENAIIQLNKLSYH